MGRKRVEKQNVYDENILAKECVYVCVYALKKVWKCAF